MKDLRFKKYAVTLAIAVLVLLPLVVLAQFPTTIPTVPGTSLTEVETLINRVARFFIAIGVILAVIFLVYGGILWMSAGSDETKIKNAKTRMKQGAWGAFIVLAVGLILQTLAGVVARTFFQ